MAAASAPASVWLSRVSSVYSSAWPGLAWLGCSNVDIPFWPLGAPDDDDDDEWQLTTS